MKTLTQLARAFLPELIGFTLFFGLMIAVYCVL
jgi:hypothetical protein